MKNFLYDSLSIKTSNLKKFSALVLATLLYFSSFAQVDPVDSLALVALYNSTNGPSWTNQANWLTGNADTWFGVTVSGGKVVSLDLSNNNLSGPLPVEIGNLSQVTWLGFSNNLLAGSLPQEIGNLSSLQYLYLGVNQLSGSIPSEFGNLSSLLYLWMASNQLSGSIPAELGNLLNLIDLRLDANQLAGNIPPELGNLAGLQVLILFSNQLSGSIPAELGNLSVLQELKINNNQLTGSIPPEIGNLTSLQHLDVGLNPLSGSLPVELGNLVNLNFASFNDCQFSGDIPASLGNLTGLTLLYLGNNQFTGTIPVELGNLVNLNHLFLHMNQLTGTIPAGIWNLTGLQNLTLDNNQLTGDLPAEIGNLVNLFNLTMQFNQLTGSIPPGIGNLTGLTHLDLGGNQLTGSIPSELGNLANLQFISLNSCQLEGAIPASFGNLVNLTTLNCGNNLLSGPIPEEIGNLVNLQYLVLYGNQITEEIPSSIGGLTALKELYLHTNQLSGAVPASLGNLTQLLIFDIGGNPLTGTLPPELGNMNMVTYFSVCNNQLSGNLPVPLANLSNLESIQLCNNNFTSLPDFSALSNLTSLNITGNRVGFEYIEPNKDVPSFNYFGQLSLPGNHSDTIPVGSSYSFSAITKSINNTYEWYLNDQVISGAADSTFVIDSIQRGDMGVYYAKITNSVITDLELFTTPARIMANATITGTVTGSDGSPVDTGDVTLFRITPSGGFDTTKIETIEPGGIYTIPDIILDDYILLAETSDPDLIPSYYPGTIYWEESDTIPVIEDVNNIDIEMLEMPEPGTGEGSVFGVVEEDFENGRVDAKRSVSRATVSVTRTAGGGRQKSYDGNKRISEEELAALTSTDEEGLFSLDNLVPGFYRINVQYPGIPMDETSDVILAVGSNSWDRDVEVAALVTDTKIIIEYIGITSLQEEGSKSMKIYPNPASGLIIIEIAGKRSQRYVVSIIDIHGNEMVNSGIISTGRTEINIGEFNSGTYILRLLPQDSKVPAEIARILVKK